MRLSRCPQVALEAGRWDRRLEAIPIAGRGGPRSPGRGFSRAGSVARPARPCSGLPRKEVIQPHLPVRLPCYDFTPLTLHTFDASAP